MVPSATSTQSQGMRGRTAVTEEERRRNRMTSNRLSARKSRMKRQQHVEELTATAERLEREKETLRAGVDAELRRYRLMEQENRVIAAHARELHATLLLRNSQLRTLADFAGVPLDVPGVPDHLAQLYGGGGGGAQVPPPPTSSPAALPLEIQMLLFQPDAMDIAAVGMLGF